MKLIPAFFALTLAAVCTSAISASKLPNPPEVIQVADTIDFVKDELNLFIRSDQPWKEPNGTACRHKGQTLDLKVTNITLTLKAISGNGHDPAIGLQSPLAILKLDPDYTGNFSNSQTQTLTIPLSVTYDQTLESKVADDSLKNHPLANALATFRNQIFQVNHDKQPCMAQKGSFKISLQFDVVKTGQTGISLQLVIFKISNKKTFTNEMHQTLDVEMELTGSPASDASPLQNTLPRLPDRVLPPPRPLPADNCGPIFDCTDHAPEPPATPPATDSNGPIFKSTSPLSQ